jgi:hypothetical protein
MMLASLLLLVYTLPLATLPVPTFAAVRFPDDAGILAVAIVYPMPLATLPVPTPAACGFLALPASLLLLVYTLPLASLPGCFHYCCCWFPCFAGILAIAGVPTAIGDFPPSIPDAVTFLAFLASLLLLVYPLPLAISLLPFLLLLVPLFCWHPCYCWCTLCRWRPSLHSPTPAVVGSLVLLASLLLLLPLAISLLPFLMLLVSLLCWHPCYC